MQQILIQIALIVIFMFAGTIDTFLFRVAVIFVGLTIMNDFFEFKQ